MPENVKITIMGHPIPSHILTPCLRGMIHEEGFRVEKSLGGGGLVMSKEVNP